MSGNLADEPLTRRGSKDVHSLKDLNQHLLKEIEHFFVSYNAMSGKEFKVLGWHGPHKAKKLAREGAGRFRRKRCPAESDGRGEGNGRPKARKAQ
jgi:inorganic pyrophosphatase